MAGNEQRHELVAHVSVVDRPAALVAGLQEERQDVLALVQPRVSAPATDLVEEESDQLQRERSHRRRDRERAPHRHSA